jgi:hypothetical protein
MPESRQSTTEDEGGGELSSRLIRAGQVAGAITAVVTAGALIWTQLKPGPPPAVLRAAVSHLHVYSPRTEYNYFNSHPGQLARERAHFRAQGLGNEEVTQILQKAGATIEFTVEVEAPAGREFSLTETLYRMPAEEAVSPVYGHFPVERFVSRADRYENTESGWIEYSKRPGTYFVEIDLVDKEGHNASPPGRSAEFRVPKP